MVIVIRIVLCVFWLGVPILLGAQISNIKIHIESETTHIDSTIISELGSICRCNVIVKRDSFFRQLAEDSIFYARKAIETLGQNLDFATNKHVYIIDNKMTIAPLPFKITYDYLLRGFADEPSGNCIISTFKIRNETENSESFNSYLFNVIKHEVGHLLGLEHCGNSKCLMVYGRLFNGSQSSLCELCKQKLLGELKDSVHYNH